MSRVYDIGIFIRDAIRNEVIQKTTFDLLTIRQIQNITQPEITINWMGIGDLFQIGNCPKINPKYQISIHCPLSEQYQIQNPQAASDALQITQYLLTYISTLSNKALFTDLVVTGVSPVDYNEVKLASKIMLSINIQIK